MTSSRLLGLRGGLFAALVSLLVALACSSQKYHFVEDDVAHCGNNAPDPDLGESDLDCGGAQCHGCSIGEHCNDSGDCAEGQCLDGLCQTPGCTNNVKDDTETGIDCGGDCKGCSDGDRCEEATDCVNLVCTDERCASPSCDDGVRNGDEVGKDCGGAFGCDGCGLDTPCNENRDCESGLCDPDTRKCALSCPRGTDECDGNRDDACETNLLVSKENCGMCGHVCELPNAESSCIGGVCQIASCKGTFERCNIDETDGCETNLNNDKLNCGACGMECPAVNGTPSCASSKCLIKCDSGFGDCDHDYTNGCEASVNDVDNCGECEKKCPVVEGETAFCVDQKCGSTKCKDGFGDCDGDGECETDLRADTHNCGRCGGLCTFAHGTAACEDRQCVVDHCDEGWDDCNGDTEAGVIDGCEANVTSDMNNCGKCGKQCAVEQGAGTCAGGSCAVVSCAPGFKNCDSDRADGGFANGCETDTASDPANCGGCENACDIPNAVPACSDSSCVVADCSGSFADCTAAEGCETDTASNILHCGSCIVTCSKAGATDASCTNGKCDPPKCDGTHLSCDGDNSNGCETDITTPSACGACGKVCGSTVPNCVPTNGTYKCQAQIAIANAAPYPNLQAAANTLSFQYTPHDATNRLILLAVAAESQGNGFAGARPDSVTYGGVAMTAGPEQPGLNDFWSPDLFIYYAGESVLSAKPGQQTIAINGATAPAETMISINMLQLNGARQTTPITSFAGGFLGTTATPEAVDPSVIPASVTLATSGSVIYSFVAAYWMNGINCPAGVTTSGCPTYSVTPPTGLTLTETLSSAALNGPAVLRAFSLFANGTSAALPAAGSYTPSWNIPYTGRMTHLAVVVEPAQGP